MTQREAKEKLREELKDLTPQQIVEMYNNQPFFELTEAQKDEVINAFKNISLKSNN
tara:strand:+ start:968 stop:1135 length:168 start_codon:yes stop_codon:yes gene_type:complete